MNKLLLSVLCVLALFAVVVPCFAETASNGVLAEERVVNLPKDQGKWYISVCGRSTDDARYQEILKWFDTDPGLAQLKRQVQFCPNTADMAIFQERYADLKTLPAVRMQDAQGRVMYVACGKDIPWTSQGLNGALVGAVVDVQDTGDRILPWRREMERRLPAPTPRPAPTPAPDPDVAPIDDGGAPHVEPLDANLAGLPPWLLAPICGVGLVLGLGLGYGRKLKQKLSLK